MKGTYSLYYRRFVINLVLLMEVDSGKGL